MRVSILRSITIATAVSVSAALLFLMGPPAAAQVPVIDAGAIAKAVEQLTAWKKQYDQMTQSIQTQKDQLSAMTGQRNLGAIIDNIGSNAAVSPEIVAQWRNLTQRESIVQQRLGVVDQALKTTMARADQVRALMQSINSTNDVKAASEMNGRIQAETTLVLNDLQRVQLMQMQANSNLQRIEQDYRDNMVKQLRQAPARW